MPSSPTTECAFLEDTSEDQVTPTEMPRVDDALLRAGSVDCNSSTSLFFPAASLSEELSPCGAGGGIAALSTSSTLLLFSAQDSTAIAAAPATLPWLPLLQNLFVLRVYDIELVERPGTPGSIIVGTFSGSGTICMPTELLVLMLLRSNVRISARPVDMLRMLLLSGPLHRSIKLRARRIRLPSFGGGLGMNSTAGKSSWGVYGPKQQAQLATVVPSSLTTNVTCQSQPGWRWTFTLTFIPTRTSSFVSPGLASSVGSRWTWTVPLPALPL
mmetsp:Transcript_145/g.305  ORF Transcript_145/g.305 Transcript_145/m.305 type:complete len:271 (-) Transcript_145:856-1668(-)